jgi:nuclear pore complex protein Nup153
MVWYIFLQSFVRKVTSRVTNLLPQPSWLSKWFTSSVDIETHRRDAPNSNDSGSEDDDSDTIDVQRPPAKRAKIPLNQRFPPNSFKISVINDQGMLVVLKCNLKCY